MNSMKKDARIAGALYLLMGLPAVFSLQYIPGKLMVAGNPGATAANILASETLFRWGMIGEIANAIGFVFVVLALYRLLKGVDKTQASLMVTLFAISVPISLLNVLNEVAALMLVRGTDFLALIDKPQRDALALLLLRLHGQGVNLAAIFWGLWLFPFGFLVIKSGFIPRILGVLLIINGFAYPVVTFASLVTPAYLHLANQVAIIPELGELWIMLWLLIKGVRPQGLATANSR